MDAAGNINVPESDIRKSHTRTHIHTQTRTRTHTLLTNRYAFSESFYLYGTSLVSELLDCNRGLTP